MTTPRKPMSFDMNAVPRMAAATVSGGQGDRQQVGARVTKSNYRQLKARAALKGVTVQALIEQAIEEFLAKQAD